MSNTPALVIRAPASVTSRSLTSAGSADPDTSNRSSTALDTLFTFCPPGPEARTKRSSIAPSSMTIASVMRMGKRSPGSGDLRRIALRIICAGDDAAGAGRQEAHYNRAEVRSTNERDSPNAERALTGPRASAEPLGPGAVLLREYLDVGAQRRLADDCRALMDGAVPAYVPVV